MNLSKFLCALSLLVSSACTASPKVRYDLIRNFEDRKPDQFDTYYLQANKIRVSISTSATDNSLDSKHKSQPSPARLSSKDIMIDNLPIEAQSTKLGLAHADNFGIRTTVNISKLANTDLVSQAGVQVTDERVSYINQAASVIKTILPLMVSAPRPFGEIATASLPLEVDLTSLFGVRPTEFTLNPTAGLQIEIGRVPPDATPLSDLTFPLVTNDFIYSACRNAMVSVTVNDNGTGVTAKTAIKIADPHFLQRVAFPIKGSITMHSQCGVSITTEPNLGLSTGLDLANALAAQGKSIKDAIEAAKKPQK